MALTDVDVALTVHIGPDAPRVTPGRQAADLTVAGPARAVYLLLWNQGGAPRVTLRLWRERVA